MGNAEAERLRQERKRALNRERVRRYRERQLADPEKRGLYKQRARESDARNWARIKAMTEADPDNAYIVRRRSQVRKSQRRHRSRRKAELVVAEALQAFREDIGYLLILADAARAHRDQKENLKALLSEAGIDPSNADASVMEWKKSVQCSVPGCERDVMCKQLCTGHYARLRRVGSVQADKPLQPWRVGLNEGICTIDGCEKPKETKGLCGTHYMRLKRHGDPTVAIKPDERALPKGEDHWKWQGDQASYWAVHDRLKKAWGPAKNYDCMTACGRKAQQWAYDHEDPNEIPSKEGPYSADLHRYMPMCISCHKSMDLAYLRTQSQKLTPARDSGIQESSC